MDCDSQAIHLNGDTESGIRCGPNSKQSWSTRRVDEGSSRLQTTRR